MAQFTADIAGMLEIFAIALGLVLLHRASKEAPAKLLKAAGWVLVAGGVVVGLCTTLYWVKYQSRGEFDSTYMGYPGDAQRGGGHGARDGVDVVRGDSIIGVSRRSEVSRAACALGAEG